VDGGSAALRNERLLWSIARVSGFYQPPTNHDATGFVLIV
jgi:hypothetical protein